MDENEDERASSFEKEPENDSMGPDMVIEESDVLLESRGESVSDPEERKMVKEIILAALFKIAESSTKVERALAERPCVMSEADLMGHEKILKEIFNSFIRIIVGRKINLTKEEIARIGDSMSKLSSALGAIAADLALIRAQKANSIPRKEEMCPDCKDIRIFGLLPFTKTCNRHNLLKSLPFGK